MCDKDGKLILDAVKRELHDYHAFMYTAACFYNHVTDGNVSKINTNLEALKGEADNYIQRLVDEAIDDELEVIRDIVTNPEEKAEILKLVRDPEDLRWKE